MRAAPRCDLPRTWPLDAAVFVRCVRGLLEAKGPATAFNGAIAICDIAVAQRGFGLRGQLSRIDLIVPENGGMRERRPRRRAG